MFTGIKTDILLSLVRHILTLAGGLLVSKGFLTADMLETIIGAILSISGTVWGAAQKVEAKTQTSIGVTQAAETGKIPVGVEAAKPSQVPLTRQVFPPNAGPG